MKIGMYGGKFLPLHMGHVNCIVEASNRCDTLYLVLSHSLIRDVQLCKKDNFGYIPNSKRLQWLDQIASSLPNVIVLSIEDSDGLEYVSWKNGAEEVASKVFNISGDTINTIFGSELEYKDIFESIYPNSKYELLDVDREEFNISATEIRKNGVYKHWNYIPNICKPYYNKKVVIIGTESCGKSTIVKKLALKYNTEYVGEFGREMCEKLNTGQPTEEYYPYIAYGHKMKEFEKIQLANKVLFIDTEAIVTQFYSELYADKHYSVLDAISYTNDYDLYIFLEDDVKWVNDGLRIHGSDFDRKNNNYKLKTLLRENGVEYLTISGEYKERYDKIIKLVDELIK